MEGLDAEHAFGAIVLQVRPTDQTVTAKQREHVVPVDPLVLALVDLDHVAEAEEALEERAVPEQVVEGGEEQGGRQPSAGLVAGRQEYGNLAVRNLDLAQLSFGDQGVCVRAYARDSSGQPPHLRDGRLGEGAAR